MTAAPEEYGESNAENPDAPSQRKISFGLRRRIKRLWDPEARNKLASNFQQRINSGAHFVGDGVAFVVVQQLFSLRDLVNCSHSLVGRVIDKVLALWHPIAAFIVGWVVLSLKPFTNRTTGWVLGVSRSFALSVLNWLLASFYVTGAYFSEDFEQRWGTQEELLKRFQGNEKTPRRLQVPVVTVKRSD